MIPNPSNHRLWTYLSPNLPWDRNYFELVVQVSVLACPEQVADTKQLRNQGTRASVAWIVTWIFNSYWHPVAPIIGRVMMIVRHLFASRDNFGAICIDVTSFRDRTYVRVRYNLGGQLWVPARDTHSTRLRNHNHGNAKKKDVPIPIPPSLVSQSTYLENGHSSPLGAF